MSREQGESKKAERVRKKVSDLDHLFSAFFRSFRLNQNKFLFGFVQLLGHAIHLDVKPPGPKVQQRAMFDAG